MKTLLIAALAAAVSPTLTLAQTPAAVGQAATGIPVLAPAREAADCGGLVRSSAFCVTAQLDQIGGLAEAYERHLSGQGWLAADGDDNRIIFVKRRDSGGCDGLQMIAFYDETKPAEATAPGYLGFATIPGNVCAAPPVEGATPQ